MKTRFLLLGLLIVMLLTISSVVVAQEATPEVTPESEPFELDICFDLADDDCEIIETASASNADITSFTFDYSLEVSATGLEIVSAFVDGFPTSAVLISRGDGVYTSTPNDEIGLLLNAVATAFQNVNPDDVTGDILTTLNALETELVRSDWITLTLYDDVIYIPLSNGNISLTLESLLNAELPFGLQNFLPFSPQTVLDLQPQNWGDVIGIVDVETFLAPGGLDISDAVNYQRLEDAEGMGQALYPFEFHLDVAQMLNMPEVQSVLATELTNLLSNLGNSDLVIMAQLLPFILPGVESDLVITQYVGADDNFVHRVTFDLGFLVDLGMLTSAPGSSSSVEPVDLNIYFDFHIANINEAVEVAPLADARPLTQEEIDQLFDSVSGLLVP